MSKGDLEKREKRGKFQKLTINHVHRKEEKEEGTVGHGNDHERRRTGEGKVVEPLRGVGKGDTVGSGSGVEQFGNVDPDETTPGEAVGNDKEVDEDYKKD